MASGLIPASPDGLMWAARLYGARDIRVDRVPLPPPPQADEVLLKVTVTSICGSDLHTYVDGRIGDTNIQSPLVLGHEFAGVIAAVGPDARDGNDEPLTVGQRVAVDPAMPCGRCGSCSIAPAARPPTPCDGSCATSAASSLRSRPPRRLPGVGLALRSAPPRAR